MLSEREEVIEQIKFLTRIADHESVRFEDPTDAVERLYDRIRELEATPASDAAGIPLPQAARGVVTEAQQFVCGGTPTPPAQRELDYFRRYLELCGRLQALIANDAYAMTFQTMGQYRTALLRALTKGTPDA